MKLLGVARGLMSKYYDIFYVRIGLNYVSVRNVRKFSEFEFKPTHEFSNKRLLISDVSMAELAVNQALSEVGVSRFKSKVCLVHPVESFGDDFSPVELQILRDVMEACGFQLCEIWLGNLQLGDEDVIAHFSGKY